MAKAIDNSIQHVYLLDDRVKRNNNKSSLQVNPRFSVFRLAFEV